MMMLLVIGGILYMQKPSGEKIAVDFDALFKKYAAQFGVDWLVLKAICMNESSLGTHPSVVEGMRNPSNIQGSKSLDGKSWGIMQLTLPTARDFDKSATEEKLNNPEYSVRLAAQFVAWLSLRFSATDPRRTEWIVKSYNQGIGNTGKEMRGEVKGYAQEYFDRFVRNYNKAKASAK